MPVAEKKTNHPYISIDPRLSGGQPAISCPLIQPCFAMAPPLPLEPLPQGSSALFAR